MFSRARLVCFLIFAAASCAPLPPPQGGPVVVPGAGDICAAGIPLPSLTDGECGGAFLATPRLALEQVSAYVSPDPVAQEQSVALPDAGRFLAVATGPNGGWAAALQAARAYVRLPLFAQKEYFWMLARECPRLDLQPERDDASAQRLLFVAATLAARYDDGRSSPQLCRDSGDVVAALQRGRPVIMFDGAHALLVTGAVYRYPVAREGRIFYRLEKLGVFDPMTGRMDEVSRYGICGADAFVTF